MMQELIGDEAEIGAIHKLPLRQRRDMLGSVVCLFGIDGSGKTTVAKRLVESLKREGMDAVYAHPKLGMRTWIPESIDDTTPIGEARPEGRARTSGLKLLAYLLLAENWLTIQLRVRWQIARGRVVVVERYWPDSLVDLVVDFGFPFGNARKMATLLQVATPSKYFMLDAPIQAALVRKPGPYSSDYLARRDETYRRLAKAIGATRIDTQGNLERTMHVVLNHIFNGGEEWPCRQS